MCAAECVYVHTSLAQAGGATYDQRLLLGGTVEFWIAVLIVIGIFGFMVFRAGQPSPEETQAAEAEGRDARPRYQVEQDAKAAREAKIVCSHCQTAGHVTTRMYQKKGSISGGKATGAILTGGISLVATGLARKGMVTQLSCSNCGMKWEVQP